MKLSYLWGVGVVLAGFLGFATAAQAAIEVEGLKLYGDFRFRYEIDKRDAKDEDRVRERIRLRPGFEYKVDDWVSFGARLSTQTDRQSPHDTLGAGEKSKSGSAPNEIDKVDAFSRELITLDKAFLKISLPSGPPVLDGGFVWFGKEIWPFWQQNEAFLSQNINPEGIALGYKFKFDPVSLQLQGGQFVVAQTGFAEDDKAVLYQAVVGADVGPVGLTAAYGVFDAIDRNNNDPNTTGDEDVSLSLVGDDGQYDAASVQVNTKKLLPIPVAVGYDGFRSDADKEDRGFVITARVGKLADKGDWRISYLRYDIERNSVPGDGAFAQDDLQTSSAFEADEFQAEYAFHKNYNVMLRYSDEDLKKGTGTGAGAGKIPCTADCGRTRFQVNLNARF